jgi:hypothetical protein
LLFAILLGKLLLLKDNYVGLGHDDPLGKLFDPHQLDHMVTVLLNEIAQFVLKHQSNFT